MKTITHKNVSDFIKSLTVKKVRALKSNLFEQENDKERFFFPFSETIFNEIYENYNGILERKHIRALGRICPMTKYRINPELYDLVRQEILK